MKILYISYYFLPFLGGGTWSSYNISKFLFDAGYDVKMLVPNIQHRPSHIIKYNLNLNYPVEIIRTPRVRIPRVIAPIFASFAIFFRGMSMASGVNAIVCQYHPFNTIFLSALVIGKVHHIPVVGRACDTFRDMGERKSFLTIFIKMVNAVNEYCIRYAHYFLVTCSEWRDSLITRYGNLSSKIGVNSNGVDLFLFSDSVSKQEARKQLKLGEKKKIILFVGRFSGDEYGLTILLRALPKIKSDYPETLLVLTGDELIAEQRAVIKTLNIESDIKTYPSLPQTMVASLINSADVCIGPLRSTVAIPLKILEYMACGKPIITGVNSVSRDLDDSNFIAIAPYPDELYRAVCEVFSNKLVEEQLISNVKKNIVRYDWRNISKDFEEIIRGISCKR